MRIKSPHCPVCGKVLRGTVEIVTGVAEVRDIGGGIYEYHGDTDMDWNTIETIKDEEGRILLNCGTHEWYSEVSNEDEE